MKHDYEIKIEKIAKEVLNIPTLNIQNSDELDFHNVSVWRIKEALKEAYKQGIKDLYEQQNR